MSSPDQPQPPERPGSLHRLAVSLGTTSVANVVVVASAFALHLVLARALGEVEYGIFSYVVTWGLLLALPARIGLDTSVVRFFAEYRIREEWPLLRGLQRCARTVCIGLGLVLASGWAVVAASRPELGASLRSGFLIGAATLPALALLGIEHQGLRGLGRVALSTIPAGVLQPLLVAATVGGLTWSGVEVDSSCALLLHLGATLLALAFAATAVRRTLPAVALGATRSYRVRQWLTVSLPLLLVSGTRRILNEIDIVLVGLIVGTTEAGIYAVAGRIARLINFGFKVGNLTTGPLIAELHTTARHRELQRTVTAAAWAATLSSLAIAVGLVATRSLLLRLFGEAFVAGKDVLLILAAGHLVNAWTGPVEHLLALTGNERTNARISIVSTAVNVLLNIPAILWLGIEGAALVTASVIAGKNVWFWFAVRRRLGINSSVFGRWH